MNSVGNWLLAYVCLQFLSLIVFLVWFRGEKQMIGKNADTWISGSEIESMRERPGVIKAFGIGAMACPNCRMVHVDIINEDKDIVATALLTFEQWIEINKDVETGIREML